MGKEKWSLSKEEYNTLLSFFGYGNFLEADIIFFGNEEGAGGYSIQANVNARCQSYGRNQNGEYINVLDKNDWTKGFWDLEDTNRPKIESYLIEEDTLQESGFTSSAFLRATARISLGLENRNDESSKWFKSFGENPKEAEKIKSYIISNLFKKHDGIQTALADWCPLPRENQSQWPSEYANIGDSIENLYLKAFQSLPIRNKQKYIDKFSNYLEDVNKRLSVLKNAFLSTPAQIIIGFGGAGGMKKTALERMFGKEVFEPFVFQSVAMGNLKSYKATVQTPAKELHIYLLPFPSVGHVYKDQETLLGSLEELTNELKKHISK
ncbi:MAG: hypothetical protein ACO1OT_01240 [Heyndrickxia sp.]